ncbi:hypothetical protein GOBAR_DD12096 [Gossypium barbadense]|nr:hypothetical protein GOBAR_DD12096 [Gossypium barbadense]
MELVDDKDVETMVVLYCGTRSNQNAPVQLFAKLASVEPTKDLTPLGEEDGAQELCMVVSISSDPSDHEVDSDSDLDVDEVPDDIDDECMNDDILYCGTRSNQNAPVQLFAKLASVEPTKDLTPLGEEDGAQELCMVVSISREPDSSIVIHNNPGAHMSRIDSDAAYAAEFSEYLEILHAHQLAVYSDLEELFVGQRFERSVRGWRKAVIGGYELHLSKSHRCRRYENLLGLTHALQHVGYLDAKNELATSQPDGGGTRVCRKCQGCNGSKPSDGESILRLWESEFPVLPDLSTWEVLPTTFELVPDKWLRRNPKGCSQSSRIHNEMDIREKSDGNLCGVCRLAGHNRNEKPYVSNAIDELEPGGVKYGDRYGLGGVDYDGGYEPEGAKH